MSIVVSLEGLDRMLDVVDSARFTRVMDQAVYRSASLLRDLTKKMPPVNSLRTGYGAKGIPVAPKHGGTLRMGLQARKLGLMSAAVEGLGEKKGKGYSGYVHDGTSRMPARPFFRWALEDFGGKDIVEVVILAALDRFANP